MLCLANARINILILVPLVLQIVIIEANPNLIIKRVQKTIAKNSSSSSPWLARVTDPRPIIGCWNRPWICNQGEFPPRLRRRCCRNRCVDVSSDVNNCGLCSIRCPFTWQCCRGLCIDTNINPFHCGRCFHRCPFLSFCVFGMCGYAQPLPPFPFPPRPPKPPFPFPPRPPKPPFPFPPKPPKPHPPHYPPRGGRPKPRKPRYPPRGGQPPPLA